MVVQIYDQLRWRFMEKQLLTDSYIRSITQEDIYPDSGCPGLMLRVRRNKNGLSKVFAVRKKLRGTRRVITYTLGDYGQMVPDVTRNGEVRAVPLFIDKARKLAVTKAINLCDEGIDPNRAERQQIEESEKRLREEKAMELKKQITLKEIRDAYVKEIDLKDRTIKDFERFTTRCVPSWLNMPIADITETMVKDWYITEKRKAPAQADYTRRILNCLFNYAVRWHPDVISKNPLKPLRDQKNMLVEAKCRRGHIKVEDFGKWFQAVEKLENDTTRDYLILVALTGLRKGEAESLQWRDVDLRSSVATILIEGDKTKNEHPHELPLSRYLKRMLLRRRARVNSEWVFPGSGLTGHLVDPRDAMKIVAKQSGVLNSEKKPVTLHDLRRTFSTVANKLDISTYTVKKLLNHKENKRDVTQSHYVQVTQDQMQAAMEKITDYLLGLREPETEEQQTSRKKVISF